MKLHWLGLVYGECMRTTSEWETHGHIGAILVPSLFTCTQSYLLIETEFVVFLSLTKSGNNLNIWVIFI